MAQPTNEAIQADIDRVSQFRGNPESEAYFQKEYGGIDNYITNQQARMTPVNPAPAPDGNLPPVDVGQGVNQSYDNVAAMAQLEEFLRTFTEGYVKTQDAQLSAHRDAELAAIAGRLEQAVAEGKISVRDAERQYEEGKKALEQEAYQDAERQQHRGHAMGLQNSQQMQGMMAGADARKNTMINENMTTRDRRINEITDRLNAIKAEKAIKADLAHANYRTGMIGAEGQAQQMYGEGMFGMMQDEHSAQRGHELTLQQLDHTHGLNLERDVKQSTLRLQELDHNHELTKERIDIEFDNMLKQMAEQFGYSKELENIRSSAQLAAIREQHSNALVLSDRQRQQRLDDMETARKQELADLQARYTPGTIQYNAAKAATDEKFAELERQLALERDHSIEVAHSEAAIGIYQNVLSDFASKYPYGSDMPQGAKDYTDGTNPGTLGYTIGKGLNLLTNLPAREKEAMNEQAMVKALEDYAKRAGIDLPGGWSLDVDMRLRDKSIKQILDGL